MNKEAEMPDGTILEFPDDTPDDVMDRAVQNYLNTETIKKQQAAKFPTAAEQGGIPGSAQSGSTFNPPESNRSATAVMQDQAANVLRGIPSVITGIPGLIQQGAGALGQMVTGGGTSRGQEMIKGAIHGTAQPFVTAGKGAIELAAPGVMNAPTPESPEWAEAAQGAGAMLAGAELPNAIAGVKAATPVAMDAIRSMPGVAARAQSLESRAAANTARALRPNTLEGQAQAQKISGELSKQGDIRALSGKGIDRKVGARAQNAEVKLEAVEDQLMQDVGLLKTQIPMRPVLGSIDEAIGKLHVRGTNATGHPDAVNALRSLREQVAKLPEYADADQVIQLRRQFDKAIQEGGGFKGSGTAAEKTTMRMKRGVSDLLRTQLNELDPALKLANRDYSIYRSAADIVERRALGDVGKIGTGLPGHGTILDDILAGWVGSAMGGPVGGAIAEGINLGRQSRGFASMKASAQQQLADLLKQQQPPLTWKNVGLADKRQMLPATAGSPFAMGPRIGESGVAGTSATIAPATREIRTGRLLRPGNPLPSPTEPPSGGHKMTVETGQPLKRVGNTGTLEDPIPSKSQPKIGAQKVSLLPKGIVPDGVEIDPITGTPSLYYYVDSATGKRFSTTVPID